ncbi:DUF397 domain-containing protein [Actinomadura sp. 6N118]|uniref:DUF397 domain-containing protein n=1 Tax=Actinomadura sp. 6N118 TaxID=3375151 RepID=UPI00378A99DB
MELTDVRWRKASRSLSNGGECVEVAGARGLVAVRDSKNPDGPVLLMTPQTLRAAILPTLAAG